MKSASLIRRLFRYFYHLLLIKPGLRFHIYETIADTESRLVIKSNLLNIIENAQQEKINVLIVGSPGLQELKDVPSKYLKYLNVTGVDLSEPQYVHELSTKIKVNDYKYYKMNAFDFLKERAEKNDFHIIINRWFTHHISKENKIAFSNLCYPILKDKGFLLTIDWFIDDYNSENELFESVRKHFIYRKKYFPSQSNKLKTKNRDKPKYWWENMHNDKDFHGGKFPSREEMLKNFNTTGFKNNKISDIADKKVIDDPHLWGHVMILSQK
tara:strand:- start:6738 stop:7544 length:807 start_codon:yes stop_codon:yes gene_type:complete